MKVYSINSNPQNNTYKSCKKPNFTAHLNLRFSPESIPCNYNKGEANFSRVINKFSKWVSEQWPQNRALEISKKQGQLVDAKVHKGYGAFDVEKCRENLEFNLSGEKCGFYWNPQSSEDNALENLKNTYRHIVSMFTKTHAN